MFYKSHIFVNIHNKWKPAPTMVRILPNKVNIIILGVGDSIKKWPLKLDEKSKTTFQGRSFLKILVSNGKKIVSNGKNDDTRLLVRDSDEGDVFPLALVNLAYANHMPSSIFKFSKQGKSRVSKLLSHKQTTTKLYKVEDNIYYITSKRRK